MRSHRERIRNALKLQFVILLGTALVGALCVPITGILGTLLQLVWLGVYGTALIQLLNNKISVPMVGPLALCIAMAACIFVDSIEVNVRLLGVEVAMTLIVIFKSMAFRSKYEFKVVDAVKR